MDYLRQQIEASLGRSEEMLISDKARHTFYRYPPDPGPPKKSSKERGGGGGGGGGGTFNSIRLKKYLGLGSSKHRSKQSKDDADADDADELHQQLQQRAYLEELRRYGTPMPPGPALYYDGTGQLAVYPIGRLHPASARFGESWMHVVHGGGGGSGRPGSSSSGRTGTVCGRGGGGGHYPSIYSSVSVKNGGGGGHHQRGALQKALRAWEPYVPPIPIDSTPDEVFEFRSASVGGCTCEDSLPKSFRKLRCNECTCRSTSASDAAPSTTSSKGRRHRQSLPPPEALSSSRSTLFGHGVDHVRRNLGSPALSNGSSAVNLYVDMPVRPASSVKSLRHSNGGGNSAMVSNRMTTGTAVVPADVVPFHRSNLVIPKRRSILECPVNPYELLGTLPPHQQQRSRRRSAPPRIATYSDVGEEKQRSESRCTQPGTTNSSRLSKEKRLDRLIDPSKVIEDYKTVGDNADCVTNISLGGQRIRLFDTVRGTMSIGSGGHGSTPFSSSKRPPLPPTFAAAAASTAVAPAADVIIASTTKKKIGFNNYADLCPSPSLRTQQSVVKSITPLTRNSRSKDGDGGGGGVSVNNTEWMSGSNNRRTGGSPMMTPSSPQHKTTISIGRSASEERILESPNSSPSFHGVRESKSDSCLRENANVIVVSEATPTSCHTVIAVGHGGGVPTRHGRLNLKINLSELSAYLKPILKKAGLNDQSSSATSSEADNSDSAGGGSSLTRELVDVRSRHKQKKRVHFLSNRSTGSEASLSPSSSDSIDDRESTPNMSIDEELPLAASQSSSSSSSPDAKDDEDDDGEESGASDHSSNRDLYDDVMYICREVENVDIAAERNVRKSVADPTRTSVTKQITTIKLGDNNRDLELVNAHDSKFTSLRRSQSERQVGVDDPGTSSTSSGDGKVNRLTPTRSNSFQCFPPHSDPLPSSASNCEQNSSEDDDNHDGNRNSKLMTFCGANNLNCPTDDDLHKTKYTAGKDIVRQQSAITFESNFKEVKSDERHGASTLDVLRSKSVPKLLPRPAPYRGWHVAACSLYADEPSEPSSEYSENSREDTDWEPHSHSEEDIYADGSSSAASFDRKYSNEIYDKPLPAPPDILERGSSTTSSEDNGCDSAIYEQIREPVEPLYEEVLDAVSYASTTSSAGSASIGQQQQQQQPRKSIFEGASRTEILNYLEDAKERGLESIGDVENSGVGGGDSGNGESGVGGGGGGQGGGDGERIIDEDEQPEHVTGLNQNISAKRNHRNRISNLSNLSDSSHTSEDSFQNDDSKETKDRHSHSSAEVERNDSGVGSETSKPSRLRRQSRLGSSEQICVDCDQNLEPIYDTESDSSLNQLVCRKCSKKRSERKEIILEIVETEIKYGRDLKIIKEEFHRPMLVAGLLTEDLLSNIFLNLDQLVEVNDLFAEKLKDALEIAAEQGDEDYSTVNVGKVFQDSSAMLHAFEAYCVRQGTASLMLTNLEKEKELLRIFLKVSQMENTLLRRLNLNSFLMVPVQRVTKYPLLLNRLYKVTPHHHQDRESLREAQVKIELHLEHINQQAKDLSGMNLWRRISNISNSQRKNILEPALGNVKLRKMALQVLQWNSDDARFALEGRLLYAAVTDNVWNKREKTLKLIPVHGLLITLGTPNSNYRPDLADRDDQLFPRNTGIRETSLILVKEKGSRFNLLREPLQLQRCVISCDPDTEDVFEIQELTTKDAYLLKAEDPKDTSEWLRLLRYHAKDLGAWRRRRNALANIMINGMVARREWL